MTSILILGGGNCQLNAVKTARARGLDVILLDYTPNPPAAAFATHHVQESSFDSAACLKAAHEYNVQGILCVGTDQPVYTAASVSEQLGLPSAISQATAFAVTNKIRMKTLLTQHAIPTVDYCFADVHSRTQQLEGLIPPLVIKPVDSQGQRGVFKLPDANSVLAHIPLSLSFSRSEQVLIESFYHSDEITVSAWVTDGHLHILSITDRLHFPSETHIGICIGHRCPTIHISKYSEIYQISDAICQAFEITNGPLYIQMLIGKDGIKVNEVACRIGGAFEDFLIPYISNFDILNAAIDCALGIRPAVPSNNYDFRTCTRSAAVQLFFCTSGHIATITPTEEVRKLPFVLDVGTNYKAGDYLPEVENATARFGHAVISAESGQDISHNIDELYAAFHVTDTQGKEMLQRYYPPC